MELILLFITFLLIFCFSIAKKADIKGVAVLLVDGQTTFYEPLGNLAVPGADPALVTTFTQILSDIGFPIIASKDSHPPGHIGEKTWPLHAVKGETFNEDGKFIGDDLLPGIEELVDYVQLKGENPDFDSYSAFYDDGGYKTELTYYLRSKHYETLLIFGEAGNYCVKASIIDALKEGFNVVLITDMTHYIAPSGSTVSETEANTIREIKKETSIRAGFKTATSAEFVDNPNKFMNSFINSDDLLL